MLGLRPAEAQDVGAMFQSAQTYTGVPAPAARGAQPNRFASFEISAPFAKLKPASGDSRGPAHLRQLHEVSSDDNSGLLIRWKRVLACSRPRLGVLQMLSVEICM